MPLKPTTTSRGYGNAHQRLRKQLARSVEAGYAVCWRCGLPIKPGTPWHLGHDDHDRSIYRGAEHARCNLSAGGRQNSGDPPIERHSRVW